MNDLRFDTEQNEFGTPTHSDGGLDLAGRMVSWGFASDRRQAEYVLLTIVVIAIIASFFAYRMFAGGGEAPPLLPQ